MNYKWILALIFWISLSAVSVITNGFSDPVELALSIASNSTSCFMIFMQVAMLFRLKIPRLIQIITVWVFTPTSLSFIAYNMEIRVGFGILMVMIMLNLYFLGKNRGMSIMIKYVPVWLTVAIFALSSHYMIEQMLGLNFEPKMVIPEELFPQVFTLGLSVLVLELILFYYALTEDAKVRQQYEAGEIKSHWFAATFGLVSHNLKTPLANVQGQLEILKLKAGQDEENPLFKHVNSAIDSVGAASSTLESTISRYKGQLQLMEATHLDSTIFLKDIKSKFPGFYKVDYHSDQLYTHEEYFSIGLALDVITENIKIHSETAKQPELLLSTGRIEIADFGKGFPESLLEHQASQMSSSTTTGGIGLYFAKQVLAAANWDMSLSNSDRGGVVTIRKVE